MRCVRIFFTFFIFIFIFFVFHLVVTIYEESPVLSLHISNNTWPGRKKNIIFKYTNAKRENIRINFIQHTFDLTFMKCWFSRSCPSDEKIVNERNCRNGLLVIRCDDVISSYYFSLPPSLALFYLLNAWTEA